MLESADVEDLLNCRGWKQMKKKKKINKTDVGTRIARERLCYIWWKGLGCSERLRCLFSFKIFKKKMYKLHGWEK